MLRLDKVDVRAYLSPEQFRGKRTMARNSADANLRLMQGTLDLLVLKGLTFGPRHGYGVASWIRATTDGTLEIEDGALYTALHRMEKRGLLAAEWGTSENNRRAKFYALTDVGRRRLEATSQTWTRYARAVFQVLETTEAPA